ncbi:MAG: alkaline phosphatase [Pirellulales bacterium]|nr:alkaline phosphatase [Pirellulales bacterium]
MMYRILLVLLVLLLHQQSWAQQLTVSNSEANDASLERTDPIKHYQQLAMQGGPSAVVHWGANSERYSTWTNHSNRLIPVYTFGLDLDRWRREGSVYSDPARLQKLYGCVPEHTLNPNAMYYDQTDIYQLQMDAVRAGYRNIIVMIFDGMDWQTTRAAACYKSGRNRYQSGRGSGLSFQDFRGAPTDFGLVVTSPLLSTAKFDVNSQTVFSAGERSTGGYDPTRAGQFPWQEQSERVYVIGQDREAPHSFTDSAASATSLFSGVKTYNGAINVRSDGNKLEPIARKLQAEQDFKIGIITSVPVSHATAAAAYANNVTRKDYQDISRDMIGLPSSSHRHSPLSGVDVLIGGGWGEDVGKDALQGNNFLSGNQYLHQEDLHRVDRKQGGNYLVAQRTKGKSGKQLLMDAARTAADEDCRLLGYFGTKGGHLPFRTADGGFDPTFDMRGKERYTLADLHENPSLAEMTQAALTVLEQSTEGFWLMVEAGDVDWANHANNIDNSIGAVISGEQAFDVVREWIDENNAWGHTAVIVTADHGHFLVIDDAEKISAAGRLSH